MIQTARAITVCVGYDDFLRLTLPRTIQHVAELTVVTTPTDTRTLELCQQHSERVRVHTTDVFYDQGASFNKGAAIEETFELLGRDGWFLLLDADILLPATIPAFELRSGKLYTPYRRIMSKVDGLTSTPAVDPQQLQLRHEPGHFGYFQLFHAADPVIAQLPWYQTDWVHAGGCDSVFEKRWAVKDKLRPPFEVIHLGDPDENWYGRTRPRLDNGEIPAEAAARRQKQEALHRKYGWKQRPKTGEPAEERLGNDPASHELCHFHGKRQVVKPGMKPLPRLRRGLPPG